MCRFSILVAPPGDQKASLADLSSQARAPRALAHEEFRIVPEPNCIFFHKKCSHLVIVKGCLSLAAFITELQLDVWIMKEYDVKEYWTKSISTIAYRLAKELIRNELRA